MGSRVRFVLSAVVLSLAEAYAQGGVTEDARLTGGPVEAQFGAAVAISGDRALVGARYAGAEAGAAVVFRWGGAGWTEEARFEGAVGDHLGSAVALDGDRAAVGAPGDDSAGPGAGAVHVLERTAGGWARVATLAAPGLADRALGGAGALDGDRLLAGAARDARGDPSPGAAVAFRFDGAAWVEEARLSGRGGFGTSVALGGPRAVVGSPFDGGTGAAAVWTVEGGEWAEEARLAVPGASAGDRAGWSVALDGKRAVVGAPGAGAVAVFERGPDGWGAGHGLRPSAPASGGGWAVAVSGDWVLVGSPFAGAGGARSGAATVFMRVDGVWTEAATLVASDAARGDLLGRSVALDGGRALVGALPPDDGPRAVGMALVYDLDPIAATDLGAGPATPTLAPPVPNPSRGGATVAFYLPESTVVRLAVVDVLGREVAVLAEGPRAAGRHRVAVPVLAPGAYWVRLAAGGTSASRPVTVAR